MDLEAADTVRATIRRLEERRYAAIVGGDVDALEELLSEQLVYTHSTASRETKSMYLARIRDRPISYQAVDHPEEAILIGDGVAVVVGTMIARMRLPDGGFHVIRNAATAVWGLEHGRWQLLAYAPTPLPT
jgi:ketosteroid isomerase-like protein